MAEAAETAERCCAGLRLQISAVLPQRAFCFDKDESGAQEGSDSSAEGRKSTGTSPGWLSFNTSVPSFLLPHRSSLVSLLLNL